MSSVTQGAPDLARYIDHTLLAVDASAADYERLCVEAVANGFYSVCVPPFFVPLAAKSLKNSAVKVCTVVGFPNGYQLASTKTFEAKSVADLGAHEMDMVLNISALRSGDRTAVVNEIRSVVQAASGRIVKVILETCYLTDDEKRLGCELAIQGGAQFVKTSTGFGSGGATEHDVQLLVEAAGDKIAVKASGSINDAATAAKMISLGAKRLGTSHGVAIVTGKVSLSNKNY